MKSSDPTGIKGEQDLPELLYKFAQLFYYILPDDWAEIVTYPIDVIRWKIERREHGA